MSNQNPRYVTDTRVVGGAVKVKVPAVSIQASIKPPTLTKTYPSLEMTPIGVLRKMSRGKFTGGYSMKKPELIRALREAGEN